MRSAWIEIHLSAGPVYEEGALSGLLRVNRFLVVSMSSLRSVSEAMGCAERERPAQHRAADKGICAEECAKKGTSQGTRFIHL